jgi:predicted  nucleic acid-binding Zn-ribbon protein
VREQLGGEMTFVVVAQDTLERLFRQLAEDEEPGRADAAPEIVATVAADEGEQPLEQLLGELEVASERLVGLRTRAERLLSQQEQTQAALDASRHEVAQLQHQTGQDRAKIAYLEEQLAGERRRWDTVKAKIGELTETLAGA